MSMSRPTASESDINFESLQREILEAEEYLVRNSIDYSAKDDSRDAPPPVRRSLDVARKNELLQQVGRKPLSLSSSVNLSASQTLAGRDRDATRGPLAASAQSTQSATRPANKYVDAEEREKLLTRLMREHEHSGRDRDSVSEDSMERGAAGGDGDSADYSADGAEDTLYYASDLAASPPRASTARPAPSAQRADARGGRYSAPSLAHVVSKQDHHMSREAPDGDGDVRLASSLEYTRPYAPPPRPAARQDDPGQEQEEEEDFRAPPAPAVASSERRPDRYDRIPVFNDQSPLDQTGRFAGEKKPLTASIKSTKSSAASIPPAKLAQYAATAAAAEKHTREEAQQEREGREREGGGGGDRDRRFLKTVSTLKEEAHARFVQDYPFAPTVSAAASASAGPSPAAQGRGISAQLVGGGRFLPVSRTGKPKQEELIDRIEKIREMHEQSLQRRDADKQMLVRAELQLCTFRPEISKGSARIIAKQQRDSGGGGNAGARSRSPHGAPPPPPPPPAGSTPRTRVFSEEAPPPPPGSGSVAASERLFREAWTRKADALERSRRLREANEQSLTFRPAINPSSESMLGRSESEYRPIHERLGDIQRSRNSIREQSILTQEHERNVDFTFTPEISERSRSIAEMAQLRRAREEGARGEGPSPAADDWLFEGPGAPAPARDPSLLSADVSERLLARGRESQRHRTELLREREAQDARNAERTVPTSKGSSMIASSSEGVGLTFLDRQAYFDHQARRHAALRKAQEDEESAKLFRPRVRPPASEGILSGARPEMLMEGPEERTRRMSELEQQRSAARRQDKEQEIYNENDYPFAPNISKVSRMLGRASSIDDLHENRRGQRAKSEAIRKAEALNAQECSFKPKINQSLPAAPEPEAGHAGGGWDACCPVADEESAARVRWLGDASQSQPQLRGAAPGGVGSMRINLREPEKMARDIRLHLAEKEEKRREILAEREISELKECTFAPRVPRNKSASYNSPVVVRGIARHLELQNLSEQKRREKAQREEEAFKVKNVNKFKRTGDGHTVVQVGVVSCHVMSVVHSFLYCCVF
jgi:hypothetical protein